MSDVIFTHDHRCFQQLFESSPDPAWIIAGNRFVACNNAAARTLGYTSRQEFLDVHPSRLSPPTQPDGQDSYSKAERMMAIARDTGLHRFEWVHSRANGETFFAEVTLSAIALNNQPVIYCVWRDITERKNIEAKLLRQNETLSTVIENFPGAVTLFDAELQLVAHNQKFASLLEFPSTLVEQPGVGFEDFIRYNAERGDYGKGDPQQQIADIVARARQFLPHKFERVRPNGTVLEISGMPLPGGGFVSTYIDITERKAALARIENLAFYDALTALPNRRLLSDRLAQALAACKRSGDRCALLFLDLDNFKPINDTHGHDVGDLLLLEASARLGRCVRQVDTVARFGGDEFIVLLSHLPSEPTESTAQAARIAEKICTALSQPYRLVHLRPGQSDQVITHQCSASVGVVVFGALDTSQDELLRRADLAMYNAKQAGRNTVRFFQP